MAVILILFLIPVLHTYLFYPLLLTLIGYVKASKRSAFANTSADRQGVKEEATREFYPCVSMVTSAYNEENNIKEKIGNFLSLDYPPEKIEFLMGSDGSTDNTAHVARSAPNDRIRVFEFDTRRGKTAVLNDIVREAKGEIIIFSDADTMYDKNAILRLVGHFVNDAVGGVCGRLALQEKEGSLVEEGLYWKYEDYLKEKESEIKTIVGINGQIFAIRRELFEALPSDSITEDQVLGMKIIAKGYDILFEPKAVCREKVRSFKGEFLRRVRISAGNFQSIYSSRAVLNPKMGFASFALWSHKILRWFVPFFLISAFIVNLFLLDILFFKFAFFTQISFYLIPLLHYGLSKIGFDIKIFKTIFYFNLMNLAVLIGFIKYLTGMQKTTWEKAR